MELRGPGAARKRGSMGWRRHRVRCEGSVREAAAADSGKTSPDGEQGGGCLTRQGPRCRGRGEAAGDCVFAAEPLRTPTVDRTVARAFAASLNSVYCRRRGLRPRPGSVGKNANMEVKRRRRQSSRGKVHRPIVGAEARRSFCKAGGPKGQAAAIPGTRDREAGPPRPIDAIYSVPTEMICTMVEAATTSMLQEQPEGAARPDRVDLRRRDSSGATAKS